MKKNIITGISFALLLSACTTSSNLATPTKQQPSLAERFAYERSASIAQVVPMKVGRFLVEKTAASKSTVVLSLRAPNIHDTNALAVEGEVNAIGHGFCNNEKVYLVIQQGVSYYFSIFNAQKNKLLDAIVNHHTCITKNFITHDKKDSPYVDYQ